VSRRGRARRHLDLQASASECFLLGEGAFQAACGPHLFVCHAGEPNKGLELASRYGVTGFF
jgi:hypothetical protein